MVNMKTKIIIMILTIFLVSSIVTAGAVISIQRPTTTLDLSQDKQDALNNRLSIPNDITEYISGTECDGIKCKTRLTIEGSIDETFSIPQSYCSLSNLKEHELEYWVNHTDEIECLEYTDYTPQEIEEQTTVLIRKRLSDLADEEAGRKIKTEKVIIIDKGVKK